MSLIDKSGISAGSIIKSEHLLRVLRALRGEEEKEIIISGSFAFSGSSDINGFSFNSVDPSQKTTINAPISGAHTFNLPSISGDLILSGTVEQAINQLSGSVTSSLTSLSQSINQTVTNLLTSASNPTGNHGQLQYNDMGVFGAANAYSSGSNIGIGIPNPTAFLDVTGSNTGKSARRVRKGPDPISPNSGDEWFSEVQNSFKRNVEGLTEFIDGSIFSQIADKTVTNTITETSIIGAGVGTLIIPGNYLKVGKSIKARIRGYFPNNVTITPTVRFKLNGTTALSGSKTMEPVANSFMTLDILLTCRAIGVSGSVRGNGRMLYQNDGSPSRSDVLSLVSLSDVPINTTISNTIDVTWQFAIASPLNTIVTTNSIVEVKA